MAKRIGTDYSKSTTIALPPKDWVVLSWHQDNRSVLVEGIPTDMYPVEGLALPPSDMIIPEDTLLDMLKQYLKKDKIWKILTERDEKYVNHRSPQRIILQ